MIAPAELARLTQSSTPHALLDLREKATYERGHIYRATSLPRRLLEFRLLTLVPAGATPLVVCDEDGRLAALARPTLAAVGYTDVRVLAGGGPAPRPLAFLCGSGAARADASPQPPGRARERDDGLGARGAHARARRGALAAGAAPPEPRGRHADGEAPRGRGWSDVHLARCPRHAP